MKHKEHKIGERFIIDHIIYQVNKSNDGSCYNCAFNIEYEDKCLDHTARCGECSGKYRQDRQDVIFVQIGEENETK